MDIGLDAIYALSEDIVAREIEGELIIVPLVAHVGNMESELYTMNETGRSIWESLDGKRDLREVISLLSRKYNAPIDDIEPDVIGLVKELVSRRMLVEVAKA